jgi:predicted alpha/beta-fold hydrolase
MQFVITFILMLLKGKAIKWGIKYERELLMLSDGGTIGLDWVRVEKKTS